MGRKLTKVSPDEIIRKSDATLEDRKKMTVLTLVNFMVFFVSFGSILGVSSIN